MQQADQGTLLRAADMLAEIETLRTQLAHWKTFAVHAEGEHAAWKKTAIELGADKDWMLVPRVPTNAMVEAICAAVAQADWPQAYFEPAQQRRRRDARLAWLEAVASAPSKCPAGKCDDPATDCFGSGCLGPNVHAQGPSHAR